MGTAKGVRTPVKINVRANPAEVTVPAPVPGPPHITPNFILQVRKEVINLPRWERKKLMRQLIATSTGLLLVLAATQTAMAAPADEMLAPDVTALFGYLIKMMVVVGVAIAILLLPVAGVWNMFNQTETAQKWTQNILKGFGQVIMGPVTIIAVVYLCHLLFGEKGPFVDPWVEVSKFFLK